MKKKILFILALVSIVMLKSVTYAATCTDNDKKALRIEANNMVIKTELLTFRNKGLNGDLFEEDYGYNLKILNASKNFNYQLGNDLYVASKINSDGEFFVERAFRKGGYSKTISIIANNKTNCNGEVIKTSTVKLPYYNKWYTRDECKGLETYSICKKNGNTSKIETEADFLKEIKKAKEEKENNKKIEIPKEKEKTKIEKIMEFISNNKIQIILVIVLLTVLIAYVIKVKNDKEKKKIKINIKELGGDK